MVGLQLMRLIERHSDQLADGLSEKLQTSERTRDFRKVSRDELREATAELYRHLGEWILRKTEVDIEQRFRAIAIRRFHQGIGAHQFVWAITMSRSHLWQFLRSNSFADNIIELYGEMELQDKLNQFFDMALYYAILGFEDARYEEAARYQPVKPEHHAAKTKRPRIVFSRNR